MKKIMLLMVFTAVNLYSADGDINLKNQIIRMSYALINQKATELNQIFDFPIKDDNMVMSYNIEFDKNLIELNSLEVTSYLKKFFNEKRDYYKLLKRINYDSLMFNKENCVLLHKSENDTCNLMCCIVIKEQTVILKFNYDNTNDLYDDPNNKLPYVVRNGLDEEEEECDEFYVAFVFEIIGEKLKFIRFELAG